MDEKIKILLKSTSDLHTLTELLEQSAEPTGKDFLERLADTLAEEISELLQEWKEEKTLEGMTIGEYVATVRPIIDTLRKYVEVKDGKPYQRKELKPAAEELPEEVREILSIAESDEAVLDDNPILKALTRSGMNEADYGEAGKIRIIKKNGSLGAFHAAVFSSAIKAYRNKKVTKSGYIVLTENKAIQVALGIKGTPSEKQKKDFRQAWEDMRNEAMTYETTESLAQIIGIEEEEIEEYIEGIKPSAVKQVDEYFVQGLKIIKSQAVNGRKTDIYMINPSQIVAKCLEKFPWYEEIPAEVQRVLKEDGKPWGYSKQRIELRHYIYTWVYKNRRARAAQKKQHRLQLPYEKIFNDCGIDVEHPENKKRRRADVATLLNHLKRCEEIADWKEYTDKHGETRGVEVFLFKERLL